MNGRVSGDKKKLVAYAKPCELRCICNAKCHANIPLKNVMHECHAKKP